MDQLMHIERQKKHLEARAEIIRNIREFFWSQHFLEVETPILLQLPGQEPYLSPMKVTLHNEKEKSFTGYLHTSPEYTMKKMLACGFNNIFSICKSFRDSESFGGSHNPEFTLVEWYRTKADFYSLMDDVENLFAKLDTNKKIGSFTRIHMRDLWKKYVDVNLDDYLNQEKLFTLCTEKNYAPNPNEPYEDLFYRIFLNEIEPKLIDPTIAHHYPAQMAALSKLSETDSRYAERVEVYVGGLELANGFSELTDATVQLRRLKEEQLMRKKLGKEVFDIDMEFIEAVGHLPKCAGIALGVDRLVQVLLSCQNIDEVLVLPASKLF